MGGTKCLRLGTCEFEDMGGVLQNDSSITYVEYDAEDSNSGLRAPAGPQTQDSRLALPGSSKTQDSPPRSGSRLKTQDYCQVRGLGRDSQRRRPRHGNLMRTRT